MGALFGVAGGGGGGGGGRGGKGYVGGPPPSKIMWGPGPLPPPPLFLRLCVVVLLFNVHSKHLRSCRDGQLT